MPELIADTSLHNGGLHESRRGGKFAVHRDFERSTCTGLQNRMVLLTYLNEDWDPAWNGALELWDADRSEEQPCPQLRPRSRRPLAELAGCIAPVEGQSRPQLDIPEARVKQLGNE